MLLVWGLMIGWRPGVGLPVKEGAGWRGPGSQEALLALGGPGKYALPDLVEDGKGLEGSLWMTEPSAVPIGLWKSVDRKGLFWGAAWVRGLTEGPREGRLMTGLLSCRGWPGAMWGLAALPVELS